MNRQIEKVSFAVQYKVRSMMNNLNGVISQEKEGFLFERTAPGERGQSPLFKEPCA